MPFVLTFAFRPGSVIVYFILYFKTAMNPEKGIENLRVTIFSNDTFGDFQAKDLALNIEESTESATPIGLKGLGILPINVLGHMLFMALILLLFFPSILLFHFLALPHLFLTQMKSIDFLRESKP